MIHINKIIYLLVALLFLSAVNTADAGSWREVSGDHFVIYYTGEKGFAKDVLRKSEGYYRTIAVGLGYPRYSDFWTWDNRVKIYIYPDHKSFLKASKQPEWSHGMADYRKKLIMSYIWSEMFIDSILPHEIAHLIFRDFVGFTGKIPLWLDEGIAQWAEESKRREMGKMAKIAYEKDQLLSIKDLMTLDIQKLKDVDKVYIRPTTTKTGKPATLIMDANSLVNVFYLAAVSVIDFLIDKYGSHRFAEFCRELRDGKSVDLSLKRAYPNYLRDIDDLEKRWREYLAEE